MVFVLLNRWVLISYGHRTDALCLMHTRYYMAILWAGFIYTTWWGVGGVAWGGFGGGGVVGGGRCRRNVSYMYMVVQ